VTYNPPTLRDLGRYWTAHGGTNLGVVGDTRHQAKGTSYHLGASQLTATAYSRRTARDRAGLTEAASAIDLGRFNGSLGHLRTFSKWLVKRCQLNSPGTQDIREVIYTDDGKRVLRWDRERGVVSAPRTGEADSSHLTHTHVSFYRDSEKRSKVGVFAPYFAPVQEAPVADPLITATAKIVNTYLPRLLAAGDEEGVRLYTLRAIEYLSRIAASAGADVDDDVLVTEINSNPSIAIHQILLATGHPVEFTESGASIAIDPADVLKDATPEQVRELALLGFFGQPGTNANVDYSLFEQYYAGDGQGNWAPKDPDKSAWATYLASKS
jgi:hypothetical protein